MLTVDAYNDTSTVVCQTTSGSDHSTSSRRIWTSSGRGLRKLVALNALVCGLELCASAGFTYLPPMMLKTGFTEPSMTFVMGIGPFLALTTVPFLGRWSDRCRRRKPFVIGIALLMVTSLMLLSNGHRITHSKDVHLQAVLLIVAVVLLDYGCHAGFNPCEALVADVMQHSDNKETGFVVYSTMISVGGCIGYIITAVDWSLVFRPGDTRKDAHGQEQAAFSVILAMFVACVLTTILVADEKAIVIHQHDEPSTPTPPMVKYPNSNYRSGTSAKAANVMYLEKPETTDSNAEEDTNSNDSNEDVRRPLPPSPLASSSSSKRLSVHSHGGECSGIYRMLITFKGGFGRLPLTLSLVYICRLPCRILFALAALRFQARSLFDVPLVLRRLFVADFCSWTALMCHNIFYTDYVGQAVYGGRPDENDDLGLYDDGVRMGSWGLLLHSITSILYVNTLQKNLIRTYGLRQTYVIGLAIFTACMTFTLMTDNLALINLLAALSGTGFAAVTTIPNMLVTAYHSDKATYFGTDAGSRKTPRRTSTVEADANDDDDERGLASDFSILDSAYFLSQIVLSLSVGTIVDLTRSVSSYIIISAVFGLLACFFSTRVVFPKNYIL